MELITDKKSFSRKFLECIKHYKTFSCCVAWAGNPKDIEAMHYLTNHSDKIGKMIVGLHFYQTSPEFLRKFMDNKDVRFVMSTAGVFHPKVYLFKNTKNDWCVLTGSYNLTSGGFDVNEEVNVLFCQDDDADGKLFAQVEKYIENQYKKAADMTDADCENYCRSYDSQKSRRKSLETVIKVKKSIFVDAALSLLTWDEYAAELYENDYIDIRLRILREAHRLFEKYKKFYSMPVDDRKRIAGTIGRVKDPDWEFFGTSGNGVFRHLIIEDGEDIANALDNIPLTGKVTKKMFNEYCNAFYDIWGDPTASATRLLSMKRPDLFLCFNDKNKRLFSKCANIPMKELSLRNYWDIINEGIMQSVWYQEAHTATYGTELVPFKVALLDTLFYKKK